MPQAPSTASGSPHSRREADLNPAFQFKYLTKHKKCAIIQLPHKLNMESLWRGRFFVLWQKCGLNFSRPQKGLRLVFVWQQNEVAFFVCVTSVAHTFLFLGGKMDNSWVNDLRNKITKLRIRWLKCLCVNLLIMIIFWLLYATSDYADNNWEVYLIIASILSFSSYIFFNILIVSQNKNESNR